MQPTLLLATESRVVSACMNTMKKDRNVGSLCMAVSQNMPPCCWKATPDNIHPVLGTSMVLDMMIFLLCSRVEDISVQAFSAESVSNYINTFFVHCIANTKGRTLLNGFLPSLLGQYLLYNVWQWHPSVLRMDLGQTYLKVTGKEIFYWDLVAKSGLAHSRRCCCQACWRLLMCIDFPFSVL